MAWRAAWPRRHLRREAVDVTLRPKARLRRYSARLWLVSLPVWVPDLSYLHGGFWRYEDTACRSWTEAVRFFARHAGAVSTTPAQPEMFARIRIPLKG